MFGTKYLFAAVFAAAPLASHAAETVYTFDRIIAVEHDPGDVLVTGTLVDDTTPTTVSFPYTGPLERCEKLLNVALTQPDTYTLTMVTDSRVNSWGEPYLTFTRCKLQRKP